MSTGSDDQSFHDRAQALFLRALERPEAGRAAWVEGECAGDRRLADEVASLLRHHRPAAELIAAQALPARLLVVRDASAPAWTRPRRMLLVVLALLAALGVGGALVQLQVRAALKDSLEDHLVSLLQTGVTGLTVWMSQTVVDADLIATRPEVAGQALELAQSGDGSAEQQARRAELGRMLDADCARRGWQGWSLVRLSDARVVAVGGPQASTGKALEAVGRTLTPDAHAALAELVERGAQVAPPHALGSALEGDPGGGEPVVTVAAVVRQDATPAAALAFQIDPGTAFTKILGRTGTGQGESFAFDRQGRLLSDSAYEDELRAAGWLGEQGAMLNLVLRDPGVDLLAGEQPAEPLDTRPLTEAVRYALARRESQFEPYRSYSGQMVVGAWTWLDEFDFGVAKELPLEQAYAPLVPWRRVLIGLWALLGLVGLAVLALSLAIRRLRERVEELAELGSYRLERPLGAGGMGTVYLARHALLRRQTAVKVLRPAPAEDELVRRFEQEVRQTALLSHPNTIEIYDYGRTPEQVFYYAMEYADGLTLERLVELEGRLPAGRAVHLLRQLCGSLAEAHGRGLVHRDVKPANVLVCERGGLCDFVKVLDFGLVKQTDAAVPASEQTAPGLLLGTLSYLPPERLRGDTAVGPRADVWALGATAYRLLTGRDAFSGATTAELCANIIAKPAPRPSEHGAVGVPPALESLVLACLAKAPEQRPADAGAVLAALDALGGLPAWGQDEARRWWLVHRGSFVEPGAPPRA